MVGGGHGQREGALDRPNIAVQGQLADGRELLEMLGKQLARGDQQPQRDGQIEAARILAQIRGGQLSTLKACSRSSDAALHGRTERE